MTINKLTDLPSLKEEHVSVLADMNIESPFDLKEAIADADGAKTVKEALNGVGPKTVDKWKELLADLDEETVVEEDDLIVEEGEYVVKAKPELDAVTVAQLRKRAEISGRRPAFKRQEWFRYAKLGEKWRRPKGIHSKMREGLKRRPPLVRVGYRGPKDVRGLHPSGFEEVLVHNVAQLEVLDPKTQAARVGGTVGTKKRIDIEDRADELGIRILNRMG
ncbi:MAG: 50S ribosomal protein L32e [Candidatus Methanomethylophilaceae archaeon]|nr:50S ribosomal protein L32e [Candidatus Methanomethylophilaceae archaeon]